MTPPTAWTPCWNGPTVTSSTENVRTATGPEIARNPEIRIRDLSPVVGLTERTVQAIVADPFRHRAQGGLRVGPMLDLLAGPRRKGVKNLKFR
jgi:hypothetical protein